MLKSNAVKWKRGLVPSALWLTSVVRICKTSRGSQGFCMHVTRGVARKTFGGEKFGVLGVYIDFDFHAFLGCYNSNGYIWGF